MDRKQFKDEVRLADVFINSVQERISDHDLETTLAILSRKVCQSKERDLKAVKQYAFLIAQAKEVSYRQTCALRVAEHQFDYGEFTGN